VMPGSARCDDRGRLSVAYWMAVTDTYKMLALLLIVVPFWTSFLSAPTR